MRVIWNIPPLISRISNLKHGPAARGIRLRSRAGLVQRFAALERRLGRIRTKFPHEMRQVSKFACSQVLHGLINTASDRQAASGTIVPLSLIARDARQPRAGAIALGYRSRIAGRKRAVDALGRLHSLEEIQAAMHVELQEDATDVGLDGVERDAQLVGDLLVSEPPHTRPHDLSLALTELDGIAHTLRRS